MRTIKALAVAAFLGLAALISLTGPAGATADPPATQAGSCSGPVIYSDTDPSGLGELVVYYSSANGGTDSACFYHRGAAYGRTAISGIEIFRCTGPAEPCTLADRDEGYHTYYAGPVAVTGSTDFCVHGWIVWNGVEHELWAGFPKCSRPVTPLAATSFPVRTTLDGRTVKDPGVPVGEKRVADMYPAGTSVDLVCQDRGPSYGGSDIWDLTTEGLWVPDAYVITGSSGMVMPQCRIPKSYPAKVDLNGRPHKGDAADAPGSIPDKYLAGQQIPIDCQASATDNGMIWDHTTDNLWVPDIYVTTGTDGFVAGLPHCDTDGIDAGDSNLHGRNTGPAGPTTGTTAEKVARVLGAARSQLGKGLNYAWGGGGMGGPSYGIHHYPDGDPTQGDDYYRYGFDCSGLTLYAFWKGAGIDIGDWTGPQYEQGRAVPLAQRAPGDLIFWGNGDETPTTAHVAIYLGNNQVIEASPPRDGNSVHITDLSQHSQPLPTVRRVIG